MNGVFLSNICNCLNRNKTQQYIGAVQLMLDEYHDLILDETRDETKLPPKIKRPKIHIVRYMCQCKQYQSH